ncbi:MAG: hypothetical protein LJE65_00420 [Desulfobacteraceae bacterium]|jgi:hypothetical protein|nr:hypothetical protein [Desulfobacteraceae bacterium]
MTKNNNLTTTIREHKTLFILIAVGLFLIELEIFAVAVMKSGRKSRLQVMDGNATVVYETDGNRLSDFNKYYFEKTFGPLENYEVQLVTREVPFPFRAWFTAAIGIPVGVVLLFGFVVQAAMALFGLRAGDGGEGGQVRSEPESRREGILEAVSRLNIFIIGFLVFLAVVAYWVVPNAITYLGRIGVQTLSRHKWWFVAGAGVFVGVGMWIVYLRYLLAKKTIESQTELNRYRLELEYHAAQPAMQISYTAEASEREGEEQLPPQA